MSKDRFYEIDFLRFMAALSVMMFHYTFRGYAADDMSPLEFPYLAVVFKYGSMGVDIFFIISGFVILLSAYNRDAISFGISRVARIYPAYWFSVLLTSCVIFFFGGEHYHVTLHQFLANFTMIHGYFDIKHVDGVYWSLLVELKFYFLIFILIVTRQIKRIEIFLFLWLITGYINYFYPLSGAFAFFLVPHWAPYFISGATFFLIRLHGLSLPKILALLLSFTLSILNTLKSIPSAEAHYNTEYSIYIIGSVIAIFYILFLLIALNKLRKFQRRYFVYLGSLTYPLYLIHQNIGFIYFNYFDSANYKYINLITMSFISLFIAYLINKYIEKIFGLKFKILLTSIQSSLTVRLRKLRLNEE
jgi:peptidoglycan/LPS O-acetylase OafA/YrhL